jgi:chemotaxis protein MotB
MTLHRTRPHRVFIHASLIASTMLMTSGCVSTSTHESALEELKKAKNLSASQAAELDALKKKAKTESDQFQQQLAGLQQNLDQETSQRKNAEQQAASLEKEREALTARSADLQNRLDGLEREKSQLGNELGDVRGQIAALEKKLADEAAQVSALESDKQQLATGTANAQSEIVKLQQRAAELEAESARVAKEREQLRQEQSRLAATLEQERQRLKAEAEEKARLAKEREQLQQEQTQLSASLDEERKRLKAEAEEKARLQQEQSQLSASLDEERKRLKAEAEDKARLEREHAAKEDEIRRLTKTQEELSQSLKDEIAKGNIKIQQVRDRLTINMVDRVLFDSGRAVIKPAGLTVLKQVSDVLNKVTDKHIRIEGHTDNVPISSKLQDKFKTNWELSTARATTVVRYLIDQGGVQPQTLSAAGYADTHPIASNDSEEGRSSNRRIEIVLYPKDLSQIAGGLPSNNN